MIAKLKPIVYIAGHYTKSDQAVNIRKAMEVANKVVKGGGIPIIPHLSHFWHMMYPRDPDFWYEYTQELLLLCDTMVLVDGYEDSVGTIEEINIALRVQTAIYHENGNAYISPPQQIYYEFKESNDWEGEIWRFYVPLSSEEVARIRFLIECAKHLPYILSKETYSEDIVNEKIRNAEDGYMKSHIKCKGVNLPDMVRMNKYDPFYKGACWLLCE